MNTPITVNSGTTTSIIFVQPDGWLIVRPSSGATATVEYTLDTQRMVDASTATWVSVGAFTSNVAVRVDEELQDTYVRITATSGSCTYSVEGELSAVDRKTIRNYTKRYINSPSVTFDTNLTTGAVSLVAGGVTMAVPVSESLTGDRTITAADDARTFNCTTALTITIPELLSPRPSFIVNPPPTGNVSLDPTGAAQLNGAGTTLTRSRASNPAGIAVVAYAESDGYGVSGS